MKIEHHLFGATGRLGPEPLTSRAAIIAKSVDKKMPAVMRLVSENTNNRKGKTNAMDAEERINFVTNAAHLDNNVPRGRDISST